MENLYEFDKGETTAIPAVCAVASLLLNDAVVMLQEMNPVALKTKKSLWKGLVYKISFGYLLLNSSG